MSDSYFKLCFDSKTSPIHTEREVLCSEIGSIIQYFFLKVVLEVHLGIIVIRITCTKCSLQLIRGVPRQAEA